MMATREPGGPGRKRRWPGWLLAGLVAAGLSAVAIYVFNPHGTASRDYGARLWGRTTLDVPGEAMEPTLPRGYQLVVDASAYRRRPPGRDDLLVYLGPDGPRVGRVVAGPGKRVAIRLGDVFVDDELLPPPEGVDVPTGAGPGRDLPETQVPPGHVFVLADNRDVGGDSRETGPVPRRVWVGRVVAVRR